VGLDSFLCVGLLFLGVKLVAVTFCSVCLKFRHTHGELQNHKNLVILSGTKKPAGGL